MHTAQISDFAFKYLKSQAEPLVDTTETVLDRILSEHKAMMTESGKFPVGTQMSFGASDLPSVTHSSISTAKVGGKPTIKKDWNHTLLAVIDAAVLTGVAPKMVRSLLQANTIAGLPDADEEKKGYRYTPSKADFTFQGLDAERACKNIVLLAEQYGIAVEITLKWNNQAKPELAEKLATLVLP